MSRKDYFKEENKLKKTAIVFSVTLLLTIVAFIAIFNLYNKKLMEEAQQSLLELGSINAVVPNERITEEANPASSSNDRGINEVKNQTASKNSVDSKVSNTSKTSNTSNSGADAENNSSLETANIENNENNENSENSNLNNNDNSNSAENMNVANSLGAEANSQDIKLMAPVSRRNNERFCRRNFSLF